MDIKRILKKSSWKGKEIGKLLIHTLADDFKTNFNPKHKASVTMNDINTMRDSIKSSSEGRVYNEYCALYEVLLALFNWNQATNQQIHHGFFRLITYLEGAISAEHMHKTMLDCFPLIMTEQEYNDHVVQAKKDLRAIKTSYIWLVHSTACYYRRHLDDDSKSIPAKIKTALEKLKKKPVSNQRVLSIYNEVMGIGYDELPDGRREDQMSEKEWEALLNAEYDKGHIIISVSFRGELEPMSPKFIENKDALSAFRADVMAFEDIRKYKAISKEEIRRELYESMNLIPVTWHVSTQPPEGLTLLDIIDNTDELYGFYEDDTKRMTEFLADYEELHNAIREELCKIKPLKERIDKLKPRQYTKDTFTWGELSDWGVSNYASVEPNKYNIIETIKDCGTKRNRAVNGIAVLKQENGKWVDPYEYIKPPMFGIKFLEEHESDIAFARNLFLSACEECLACFALMDILGNIFDVTEVTNILKSKELGLPETKIEGVNLLAAMLYREVGENPLVKKLFPPIDTADITPTARTIEAMRTRLLIERNLKYQYAANLRNEIIKMSRTERQNAEN
jgi:hypothetical protein